MFGKIFGSNGEAKGSAGELLPLQPGNVSDNPSDAMASEGNSRDGILGCSKSNMAMGTLVAAVLVLYFGFPTGNSVDVTHRNQQNNGGPGAPPFQEEDIAETVMYRPFCIHYGEETNARVKLLQTSMQNPSQQWSSLPCYHESQRKGIWAKRTTKEPQTDIFGAPDASLQVDFSQLAFPQRETPILGFGGAFTEASSLNFHSLDEEGQEAVLELLFGKSGLGYSKGRVHINSCDFSVESYSFDDTDGDFKLKDFDTEVTHDVESGMVDMALRATAKLREAWTSEDGIDGTLRLYASPWSPPAWMKSPTWKDKKSAEHAKTMLGSAQPTCLREGTKPESPYAKAWALYFSKFLTACKYSQLGSSLHALCS